MVAMSSTVSALIADTTKIDVKDAPTTNEIQERLVRLCNDEQSKCVLGGTLGTDAGNRGARSLGEVHTENELVLARADARCFSSMLRNQLLTPMVQHNFGENAPVPKVKVFVDNDLDVDKLAERYERWHRIGGKVGTRSGATALGIPPIEQDEEVI